MFPERLKTLRKKAGLTQKELANIFNISQPALANWEKGTKKPTQEKLKPLADFFSVSTDYLLGKTDIENPDDELDFEKVKESLKKSLGFTGTDDIPEEELEAMALAFIEHFSNKD